MKKAFILPILSLLLITACEKEQSFTTEIQPVKVETKQDIQSVPTPLPGAPAADRSSNQVTICHQTGNGEYNPIEVNENAVAAHLAHGDYLPDADGDGYSAVGACTGSQDDCDDTNAAIHPGAEEVTGNGLDDDCDPNTPDGCPKIQDLLTVTLPDGSCLYVHPTDNINFIRWGGYRIDIPGLVNKTYAEALVDFAGEANTQTIVDALGTGSYAAKLCADLDAYGYQDWYLPAAGELNAMYQQLGPGGSGQMISGFYWSSSENSDLYAWPQYFVNGVRIPDHKSLSALFSCRCVRR